MIKNILTEHRAMFIGVLVGILAALCFSIQGILAKLAYQEETSTVALLAMRYLIAFPVFFIFVCFQKSLKKAMNLSTKSLIFCILAGFFGGYVSSILDFYAMNFIDAGIARTIFVTFPAFVIILTAIRKLKMPPAKHIIIFFIVQIGVYMITDDWGTNQEVNFNMKGALISLLSAFFYAVYIMFNEQEAKIGSVVFVFYLIASSTVFMLAHFLFTEPVDNLFPNYNVSVNALIFATVGTFLPWLFFAESVRRLGGTIASLVSMSDPVFTIILGYFILGEKLSSHQMLGMLVIVISLCLLMVRVSAIFSKKHEIIIEDPLEEENIN